MIKYLSDIKNEGAFVQYTPLEDYVEGVCDTMIEADISYMDVTIEELQRVNVLCDGGCEIGLCVSNDSVSLHVTASDDDELSIIGFHLERFLQGVLLSNNPEMDKLPIAINGVLIDKPTFKEKVDFIIEQLHGTAHPYQLLRCRVVAGADSDLSEWGLCDPYWIIGMLATNQFDMIETCSHLNQQCYIALMGE